MDSRLKMVLQCKQCEATFINLSERRKHVRKDHSNRIERTCCGQTFKTMRLKLKHNQVVHGSADNKEGNKASKVKPIDTGSTMVKPTAANDSENCEVLATAPDGKEIILYYSGWHPFSNFHNSPFFVDAVCHRTVEHYYQSEKARYFKDFAQQWNILNSWTPLSAKKLGSRVQGYDADRWNEISYRIMAYGVREKIRQNRIIEEKLLSTGNRLIAEASRYDAYWGIGKDRNDPDVSDYQKWPGYNAMGNILMDIRTEIMNQ